MWMVVRIPAGNITNIHYNFVVAKPLVFVQSRYSKWPPSALIQYCARFLMLCANFLRSIFCTIGGIWWGSLYEEHLKRLSSSFQNRLWIVSTTNTFCVIQFWILVQTRCIIFVYYKYAVKWNKIEICHFEYLLWTNIS